MRGNGHGISATKSNQGTSLSPEEQGLGLGPDTLFFIPDYPEKRSATPFPQTYPDCQSVRRDDMNPDYPAATWHSETTHILPDGPCRFPDTHDTYKLPDTRDNTVLSQMPEIHEYPLPLSQIPGYLHHAIVTPTKWLNMTSSSAFYHCYKGRGACGWRAPWKLSPRLCEPNNNMYVYIYSLKREFCLITN